MTITSLYEMNQILIRKFTKNNNKLVAFEVLQIESSTCSAGTQIFYFCRPIIITKEPFSKEEKWNVNFGVGKTGGELGWEKLREDELLPAPANITDILSANQ